LRAAYLLLFKYTNLQYKVKEEKESAAILRQECEQLKARVRADKEAADARYKELSDKRISELEKAVTVERGLREQHDRLDKEWRE
jgi:predicted RNase H-like nuclease (RuvC/YqgF family)